MSWKATGYVGGIDKGLTRSEKLLMLIIADHYNEEQGWAWPSVQRLEKRAMMTDRNVYRLLAQLERKGFLEIEHNGGRAANRYRFPGLEDTPDKMTPPDTGVRGALTRQSGKPIREPQTEDEPQRAAEVYDQLVQETGTASSVRVPEAYWKAFEGSAGTDNLPALNRTIQFANWLRQKEDPPLQLPVFVGNLTRLGAWIEDKRIPRAPAEDALETLYQRYPSFSPGVSNDRMLFVLDFFTDEYMDLLREAA